MKDGYVPTDKVIDLLMTPSSVRPPSTSAQEGLLYRVAAKAAALEIRVKQLEKKVEFLENELQERS